MFSLKKETNSQKIFFWNMAGGISDAATSVILLIATTRIVGEEIAGIVAISMATAQLLNALGNYGMRGFQVTDLIPKYPFPVYHGSRFITCGTMLLAGIIYAIFSGYIGDKMIVLAIIILVKLIDAYADVLEGLMQQAGRLDLAGKAQLIRTLFYSVGFVLTLTLAKSIIVACLAMLLIDVLLLILCNILPSRQVERFRVDFSFTKQKGLLLECFPVFAAFFMMLYLGNAPRYAIDAMLPSQSQAIFGILYTPAQIINLISAFAFKPLLKSLAENWDINRKKYIRTVLMLIINITVITILVEVGAYFWGIPILSFVYGIDLDGMRSLLMLMLLGGGVNAIAYMLYYALTASRKQMQVFVSFVISSVFIFFVSVIFVRKMGLLGAALSYVVTLALLSVLLTGVLIWIIIRNKKNEDFTNLC